MGAVWRLIAFFFGIVIGIAVLASVTWVTPGLWLPVGLAFIVTLLMYSQPWLTKRKLAGGVSASLGLGVCAGWLASSGFTARSVDPLYLPALVLEIGCGIAFLTLLARTIGLPKKQRGPGWWVVGLIVMAWLVSVGSSSEGSADTMHNMFVRFLGMSSGMADEIIPVLRKTIHFSFYGLMGWTAYRAALAADEKRRTAVVFALLLTLSIATFDETRQVMAPGRGPSPFDVLLDMMGASTFLLLAQLGASQPAPRRKLSS